ncbi:MAG: AgmX/PglI C-terminal domain-containing protein [Deltaproteobacteria bacterium]|nr:AgmX/PglI C-terminal domain-containing protein [Deltaproteobacteria bacterium]
MLRWIPGALLVLASLGARARADEGAPASIQLGAPGDGVSLDDIAVVLRLGETGTVATVTLSLSTTRPDPQEVLLPIAVPRGGAITAMEVTLDRTRLRAIALPAGAARTRYDAIHHQRIDPALLEWAGTSDARDQLRLRVFPVVRAHTAQVVLTVALPRTASFAIEPIAPPVGQIAIEIHDRDGLEDVRRWDRPTGWVAVALSAAPPPARRAAPQRVVTAATSLFAGEPMGASMRAWPRRQSAPVISCALGTPDAFYGVRSVDPQEIRALVTLHHPQLRTCYQRAAQRDHALAGEAVLHFAIDATGAVDGVRVDGTLDDGDAVACLASEVATWRFREGSGVTAVNYPLRFALSP